MILHQRAWRQHGLTVFLCVVTRNSNVTWLEMHTKRTIKQLLFQNSIIEKSHSSQTIDQSLPFTNSKWLKQIGTRRKP